MCDCRQCFGSGSRLLRNSDPVWVQVQVQTKVQNRHKGFLNPVQRTFRLQAKSLAQQKVHEISLFFPYFGDSFGQPGSGSGSPHSDPVRNPHCRKNYILCACQVPVHAELEVPLLGPDGVPDGEGEQQQQRRVPWVLIPPPPHAPDPPTQPGEEAAQRWPATRLTRAQLNRWAHGPNTV
jgi:hypothetical protein